jgi:hypothetical protein
MIHADGTVCAHAGVPRATVHDEDGPVCAGGHPVTHTWSDGKTMPVREAWELLQDAYGGRNG